MKANQLGQLFFIALLLASGYESWSQDVIVKRDGSEIQTKVIEVGSDEIKYYKAGTTSPIYSIKKSEVFMIRYENGSKDVFEAQQQNQTKITPQPQSSPISNREIKKTRTAATVGYILTVPIMLFGAAAASIEETGPSIAAGSIATLIAGVGIPLVAGRGRKTRELANVDGSPGIRTAGWVTYGFAIADAVVMIGIGAADVEVPDGAVISVAVLGSLSSVFMSMDASATARQANKYTSFLKRVQPTVGMAKDPLGNSYQTVGLKIKF